VSRSFGLVRAAAPLISVLVLLSGAACATPPAATPPAATPPPTAAPAPGTASTSPSPAPTACGTGWGSVDETVAAMGTDPLVTIRPGSGACSDRIEFEVDGPAAGYTVGYVDAVVQDGSGDALPVTGGARLRVQLHHPAYDEAGQPTIIGRSGEHVADVRGYPTLRSVVFAGSFEGYSTFGVGVRARLPYQVSIAPGPGARSLIVLAVAHRWS
jgi:hypothetical protein